MARLVLWLTQGRFERFHSKEDSWLKRKLSLFSMINTEVNNEPFRQYDKRPQVITFFESMINK